MTLRYISLFSGIGSPEKALTKLGIDFELVAYSEFDKYASKSYAAIHDVSEKLNLGDITKIDASKLPTDIDLISHGSPCQDFSIAGKNAGGDESSGTRSSLMYETLRIVKAVKPKFVLWENVKNVLSKQHIHNFNQYLKKMESLGYKNSFDVLDACDFGLPQARQRVFCISILGGKEFNFQTLKKTEMKPLSDYLEDKETFEDKYVVTQPSVLRNINHQKSIKRMEVISKCAKTITCKQMRSPGQVVKYKDGYRYLTERECWRLQGFSDSDFDAALEANQGREGKLNGVLYRQAGNSIPVNVLEAIFRSLILNEKEEVQDEQMELDL